MRIDPTDPSPPELAFTHQIQSFFVGCGSCLRQILEIPQNIRAVFQVAAREFAEDERVHQNRCFVEKRRELRLAFTEMFNPDRTVDEHHLRSRRPPSGNRVQLGFTSSQSRQTLRRFPCDQRFQPGMHERGFFFDSRQASCPIDQNIIDNQSRSHMHKYASYMHTCQPCFARLRRSRINRITRCSRSSRTVRYASIEAP